MGQRLGLRAGGEHEGESGAVSTRELRRGVEGVLVLQRGVLHTNDEPAGDAVYTLAYTKQRDSRVSSAP
jgi:hypothetical protein